MHYDDQNYRLPTESRTPMLQVTHGCSYNKCNYCTLYYKTPFSMSDFKEIQEDIKYIGSKSKDLERIYLMNGDPFALSTEKLIKIIDEVKKYIPTVKSFSMFASVLNIQGKTDKDLALLRSKGITDLYMGSESFHDPSLDLAGVGYGSSDSLGAIKRLEKANIGYSVMMILGLGGGQGEEMAEEIGQVNGKSMSLIRPINITITSLFVPNNTTYGKWKREGKLREATEIEKALELRAMVQNLDLDPSSYFYSFHDVSARDLDKFLKTYKDKEAFASLYKYYNLKGHFPADKAKALEVIGGALKALRKYPQIQTYPWFSYKDQSHKRTDIKKESQLLKPREI